MEPKTATAVVSACHCPSMMVSSQVHLVLDTLADLLPPGFLLFLVPPLLAQSVTAGPFLVAPVLMLMRHFLQPHGHLVVVALVVALVAALVQGTVDHPQAPEVLEHHQHHRYLFGAPWASFQLYPGICVLCQPAHCPLVSWRLSFFVIWLFCFLGVWVLLCVLVVLWLLGV